MPPPSSKIVRTPQEAILAADQIQRVLKALGSPVRREILWKVWAAELPVAEIAAGLGVTAPTVSEHLAILRAAELVAMRPDGTTRWYRARREEVAGFRGLLDESFKWATASSEAKPQRTEGSTRGVVVVTTDAACSAEAAFRAFTDARLYSAFLGGEVTLDHGQFAATLDIGQVVRGAYLFTCAPSLIIMEWDFHFKEIPVPGAAQRAHLIITPRGEAGCRLEVNQFIATPDQAAYMESAWRYVLNRFSERIESVLAQDKAS